MRTPSQNERVLALLRERGDRGLNTSELQELPTADGGAPVLRLAARVNHLKGLGCTISSRRESNGTSTYRLVSEPEAEQETGGDAPQTSPEPVSAPSPSSLFDSSEFAPRGDYRDAA